MPYLRSTNASMTIPKSLPDCDDKSPATFSMMRYLGCVSSTSRMISQKSPDLLPAKPLRSPATLRSWHGNPAVMIPRSGINPAALSCSPVTSLISLNSCVSGKCFASTSLHFLSISTDAQTFTPALLSAKSKPPIPANKLTAVKLLSKLSPYSHH